jgi:hypothetical protein
VFGTINGRPLILSILAGEAIRCGKRIKQLLWREPDPGLQSSDNALRTLSLETQERVEHPHVCAAALGLVGA